MWWLVIIYRFHIFFWVVSTDVDLLLKVVWIIPFPPKLLRGIVFRWCHCYVFLFYLKLGALLNYIVWYRFSCLVYRNPLAVLVYLFLDFRRRGRVIPGLKKHGFTRHGLSWGNVIMWGLRNFKRWPLIWQRTKLRFLFFVKLLSLEFHRFSGVAFEKLLINHWRPC